MWLCWLIERGATPIASTGGALDSTGTMTSSSTPTDHGQRADRAASQSGSLATSAIPKMRRQPEA
jgi:hypothetical protein